MIEFLRFIFHSRKSKGWQVYREHTQAIREWAEELRCQNEQRRGDGH